MSTPTTYVGIDAHQKQLHVAMLQPGASGPEEWQVAHEPKAVQRLARKLLKETEGEVLACYEAGPVGFSLQRRAGSGGTALPGDRPGAGPAARG